MPTPRGEGKRALFADWLAGSDEKEGAAEIRRRRGAVAERRVVASKRTRCKINARHKFAPRLYKSKPRTALLKNPSTGCTRFPRCGCDACGINNEINITRLPQSRLHPLLMPTLYVHTRVYREKERERERERERNENVNLRARVLPRIYEDRLDLPISKTAVQEFRLILIRRYFIVYTLYHSAIRSSSPGLRCKRNMIQPALNKSFSNGSQNRFHMLKPLRFFSSREKCLQNYYIVNREQTGLENF